MRRYPVLLLFVMAVTGFAASWWAGVRFGLLAGAGAYGLAVLLLVGAIALLMRPPGPRGRR
jgi:hypothetical protein